MGKTSLLLSDYIIDGIRMEATPGMMLELACGRTPQGGEDGLESIIDESIDPSPEGTFSPGKITAFACATSSSVRKEIPLAHIGPYTRMVAAGALVESLWLCGHYRLNDLQINMRWIWNARGTGSAAAFYSSVESVCDYLDSLGVTMGGYSVEEGERCSIEASVSLSGDATGNDEELPFFSELPFRTGNPRMTNERKCPSVSLGNSGSWLVYIPFDTCSPRLGGSLLSEVEGIPGGTAPAIADPDYFIDCYEVVREMVEDGIISSGITVGDGGLMKALRSYIPEGKGIEAQLGGISGSSGEKDMVKILFAEIPGVIIEINDTDYDYLDAELLLQDVAYYPIGHITDRFEGVRASMSGAGDISGILLSLMSGGASEGED